MSVATLCQRCGDEFTPASTLGPPAKWCSRTCRENAYRERKQGIEHRERWMYQERPWAAQAEWFETDDEEIAIDICGVCDVASDCLDYALRTRQEYGVWGGKTPKQRTKVRRRR